MKERYRFQFPIGIQFYQWGLNCWLRKPIVKKYICPPMNERDDGSLSGFLNMFDDNS